MDFSKAQGLIEQSERVAVITPDSPSIDCLASAEALITALTERGKIAGVVKTPATTDPSLTDSFPRVLTSQPLPKEFIVSVNTAETPIAQLRYEKLDDRVEVVLTPKSLPVSREHVSFREGSIRVDAAVLVGVSNPEALTLPDVEPGFFKDTPLVNIDVSPENTRFAEANVVNDTHASLSELTYRLLTQNAHTTLSSEIQTLLLAGIVSATDTFRAPATTPETLRAASELMQGGANRDRAHLLARAARPLSLVQLVARASVRSKIDSGNGVLWSFVTAEDFEKTGRSKEDLPLVLEHLTHEVPAHRGLFLLWQERLGAPIHAAFRGNGTLAEAVQARTDGAWQNPNFILERSFGNFIEAEEYLAGVVREAV